MSEYLPTIWPANPHTLAKHRILAAYLKAWMPIVSRQISQNQGRKEILFIDGFAGPGYYTGGENGSPVVAMDVAVGHVHLFPVPVSFLFIEHHKERYDVLVGVIERQKTRLTSSPNVRILPPAHGKCSDVVERYLDDRKQRRRLGGPILAFLDQFGYGDVPMLLIGQLMADPMCEVFSYMEWRFLGAFMADPTKAETITRAFGDESWKSCLSLRNNAREQEFLRLYSLQLRKLGNAKFVWSFAMCGDNGQTLYWLFFCTNSLRGIEEMKKAMWQVDEKGGFRFSDSDNPNQLTLSVITVADDPWLSNHLYKRFAGQSLTVAQIKEYVLLETPCYKFKEALGALEREGKVKVKADPGKSRTRGSFANDSIEITFVRGLAQQQSLL